MSFPDVGAALYTRLTADAGVSALVGSRVSELVVPNTEAVPWVRYYIAVGTVPNTEPRDTIDERWRVECTDTDRAGAWTLCQAVSSALHEQTLTLSGWTNYKTEVSNLVRLTETVDGRHYWRFIVDVRIRASQD